MLKALLPAASTIVMTQPDDAARASCRRAGGDRAQALARHDRSTSSPIPRARSSVRGRIARSSAQQDRFFSSATLPRRSLRTPSSRDLVKALSAKRAMGRMLFFESLHFSVPVRMTNLFRGTLAAVARAACDAAVRRCPTDRHPRLRQSAGADSGAARRQPLSR